MARIKKVPEPAKQEEVIISDKQINQDLDELDTLIRSVWKRMVVDQAKRMFGESRISHRSRTDATYAASSKKYNVKIFLLYDENWSAVGKKVRTVTVNIAPSKNYKQVTRKTSWGGKYTTRQLVDPSYVHFRMNIPVLDDSRLKDLVSLAKRVMSGVGK